MSSGDTSVTYDGEDGFTVDRVVTTDAAANGGNSGGPALDRDGEVVGLVSGGLDRTDDQVPVQGTNYLVPASVIEQTYADLRDDSTRPPASCPGDEAAPVEDEFQLEVTDVDRDDDAATVRATFRTIQDASAGRDGQECSDWDVTYRMQLDQGTWLIDATDLSDGYPRAC